MVCGVSRIPQNARCSSEAACPKDVVQGTQWKSNFSPCRPYDLTEGFPVLVCAVEAEAERWSVRESRVRGIKRKMERKKVEYGRCLSIFLVIQLNGEGQREERVRIYT